MKIDLKKVSIDDLLSIDISKLNKNEVAIVERRLTKVANQRITRLKKAGKLGISKLSAKEKKGFTPYKPPKGTITGGKVVIKGKTINVRNKMVKNAVKVQEFLNKKGTRIREVNKQLDRYRRVIRNTLGNSKINITERQAKRISRLMNKAKEMMINNDANKKMSGSPRLLQQVVDIVKNRKYIKNDEAEKIISEAITNGYESSQRMLNELAQEDNSSLDIDSGNEFNPFK